MPKVKKPQIKKKIRLLFVIIFTWVFLQITLIAVDGVNDELAIVDAVVILGNKVELDGHPSNRLIARLDKAIELYDEGYFRTIIVSGGIGTEGFDEAKVMKEYLVKQGIRAESIIEDNNGYNTYMTAENSKAIMQDLGLDSVMIITQYFHISRTKLAFKKLGFKNVYSAHAEIFELRDIYSTLREFPAYYKYLLK